MATIGVMGSGKQGWDELAAPLGVWIAQAGHNLLTGGGGGTMTCVARAFCSVPDRRGRCIGVLPSRPDAARGFVPLDGYPNPYVEISILTPLPRHDLDTPPDALSRNHVNVLSSDLVVALPGGQGTRDEVRLGLLFGKPVVGFGPARAFDAMPPGLPVVSSVQDVAMFADRHLGGYESRR